MQKEIRQSLTEENEQLKIEVQFLKSKVLYLEKKIDDLEQMAFKQKFVEKYSDRMHRFYKEDQIDHKEPEILVKMFGPGSINKENIIK